MMYARYDEFILKNSNEDASALIDANYVPEVSNPHRKMGHGY